MIMSMLTYLFGISVIWFHYIKLQKPYLFAWGQKNGWGTLTNIFFSPQRNSIRIFIVINSFDTTLPTFYHWRHTGRNLCTVLIFLNTPFERWNSIFHKITTARALVEQVLKTFFTTWCHTNLCLPVGLMCCGFCGTTGWCTKIVSNISVILLEEVTMVIYANLSHWNIWTRDLDSLLWIGVMRLVEVNKIWWHVDKRHIVG